LIGAHAGANGKGRRIGAVEIIGFIFALFTLYGCGPEPVLYGLMLLMLGIPVYVCNAAAAALLIRPTASPNVGVSSSLAGPWARLAAVICGGISLSTRALRGKGETTSSILPLRRFVVLDHYPVRRCACGDRTGHRRGTASTRPRIAPGMVRALRATPGDRRARNIAARATISDID
jgi:hypothetical protein